MVVAFTGSGLEPHQILLAENKRTVAEQLTLIEFELYQRITRMWVFTLYYIFLKRNCVLLLAELQALPNFQSHQQNEIENLVNLANVWTAAEVRPSVVLWVFAPFFFLFCVQSQ